MERTLIVTLLQKSIEELAMMTDGFMEMTEYPAPMLRLARRKAEDVIGYLEQLEATSYELQEATSYELQATSEDAATSYELQATSEEEVAPAMPSAEISPDGRNDEGEEAVAPPVISNEVRHEVERKLNPQQDMVPADEPSPDGQNDEGREEETPAPVQPSIAPHTDNTNADAHSMKKVDDIRQAISIGDHFRFQRELFAGNGELMNKTIAKLNQMASLDEAMKYLQAKFTWKADDETADSFLQILRRRYS